MRELRLPVSAGDALREPRMVQPLPGGDLIVLRWTPKMPGMGLVWFLLPGERMAAYAMGDNANNNRHEHQQW